MNKNKPLDRHRPRYTKSMRLGLCIACTFTLLLPVAVWAQTADDMETFSISVDPQYPAPQSQATLSVLSSTLDLASATMAVSVAGKEIYRGSAQSLAIPLGRGGKVVQARVTIISAGTEYRKTVSIQPQDVALVAEPISSAPPLYPGKSLVPEEGNVRVVAMANLQDASGRMHDPATYSYSWTVDEVQIADASGVGKRSIVVASPLRYRSHEVSVAVMSQDGSMVGGASLSFTAENASLRIYRNDPLLGILYDRALSGDHAISSAEETLFAAPFSLPLTSGAPLFQWFLNGAEAQTGRSITLRPSGKGQGSASLSLVVSAGESAKATDSLSLSFGAASSGFGSFFGL